MFKFNNLNSAKSFVNRSHKIMMIVLGDDNKFWVVTPKKGEFLIKNGYEYAQ